MKGGDGILIENEPQQSYLLKNFSKISSVHSVAKGVPEKGPKIEIFTNIEEHMDL